MERQQSLLFLHIPKNAGSTIEDVAHEHGVRWGKYMNLHGCAMTTGRCNAIWHEPPALLGPANVYTGATVFCAVRNPYARAVSEYKYVYSNPEFRWEHYDLVEEAGCSSWGLNEWLVQVLRQYLNGDTYKQLCHLLPQSYYIWGPPDDEGRQCRYCHEILRVEDFPNNFNDLMKRHDYPVRLSAEHRNIGGCPNLSYTDLNLTALQMLTTVYYNDFVLLNYSMDPTWIPKMW